MTKNEATQALEIAKSDRDLAPAPGIMDGFGLPGFEPVNVTLENVAAMIRWQCFQLNGGIDAEELNDIVNLGRKRFMIIG